MRKAWLQFTIFIAPILIYILVPVFMLWQSGENFRDLDPIVKSDKPYMIGFAYNEKNYAHLKWRCLSMHERKTVLAVGSSRVLQFRTGMFKAPFYNAGYTVSRAADFLPMLKKIPENKRPEFLIIGIDQWMLNESWVNLENNNQKYTWPRPYEYLPDVSLFRDVWGGLIHRKLPLFARSRQDSLTRIGLNANVFDSGFRNDGSMNPGRTIVDLLSGSRETDDYQYRATFARIDTNSDLFTHGSVISEQALADIDRLLEFCKSENITVIAFLPPFADAVYQRMQQSGFYEYIDKVYPAVSVIFKKHDVELHDFSHVSLCNSTDRETIDGFHGSEMTYAKMLLKMLDSGSQLRQVIDRDELEKAIAKPVNRYQVYP